MECKCSLRERVIGDGCEICNPNYANQFENKKTIKPSNKIDPSCLTRKRITKF